MNVSAQSVLVLKGKWPHSLIIRTTLYDLIAAINAEVGADEDDLVIALVIHLLKTHWLTYVGTVKPRRFVTNQSQAIRWHHKASTAARNRRIIMSAPGRLPSRPSTPARYLPSIGNRRPPAKA
jgi:hypothetical protein